ncbi:bifunctional lysozyme/C40 family peptidase [Clostridium tyrobutyricum]|uniref:bifunctional lytic transglycosylase/C40 family peptidase n=1 Tax=Clostridium tyrobutyricum TaxID=1519 RepID=UPI001C38CA14|nr:bifunctional lytic transglycosylase/C40 family peptidase [Clostridium tyrobutyricum]MBV4432467.1 bifunctional lysozyme/C40 family peptidase [Clostridium tyrobutyricum]
MKKIIIAVVAMFFIIIVAVFGYKQQQEDNNNFGKANIPVAVQKWRPLVSEVANKYKVGNYTEVLLAIVYQESGDTGTNDIMQSSESEGLPPNSIVDPETSLNVGIKYFSSIVQYADKKKCDLATIIQSYNFGQGYVDYVASNGGKSTKELAESFSASHGGGYGDPSYYDHVMRYVSMTDTEGAEGASQSALGSDLYKKIIGTAGKFQGEVYVFGGSNPSTGFDCSGLTQYVYGQAGINLPRTAQAQYDATSRVAPSDVKPGDLVFFQGTYNAGEYITHVGIYVGGNKMYQSGGHGIGYASLDNSFWKAHLAGYGRVRK